MKYPIVFVRFYFGLHCLFSGANFYLQFSRTGVMTDPVNSEFMDAITRIGMYSGIKTIELIVGICIVTGYFLPLALIVEFPISVTIFILAVHQGVVVHEITGAKELLFNVILFAAYAGCYMRILTVKARQTPVWNMRSEDLRTLLP